jgi:uncharacterized membrane protein
MRDAPFPFLLFALVGFIGAVFTAIRAMRKASRYWILTFAFLAFAFANASIYLGLPDGATWSFGGILAVLLLADVVVRAAQRPS